MKELLFLVTNQKAENSDLIYSSYRKGRSFGMSMSYDF